MQSVNTWNTAFYVVKALNFHDTREISGSVGMEPIYVSNGSKLYDYVVNKSNSATIDYIWNWPNSIWNLFYIRAAFSPELYIIANN